MKNKKFKEKGKTIIRRITRYLQNNRKTAMFWRYQVNYFNFNFNFLYSLFFLIDLKVMDFVIIHKATGKELVERLQKIRKENLLRHYFFRRKLIFKQKMKAEL